LYAVAREGKAWAQEPTDIDAPADLTPIFEAILEYIPEPIADPTGDFQMLISALDWDSYQGKYAIGKVTRGVAKTGLPIAIVNSQGVKETTKIDKIFVSSGLKRVEVNEAVSGDIIAITGLKNAGIGETVTLATNPEALPTIEIEEPTLSMAISANSSPFAGREGQFVTGRQILDRIKKELETNVSLKLRMGEEGEYIISGRGELHLSVFIETLRREGYELQIGRPQVITKEIDGHKCEPFEELTIDVESEYANNVIGEIIKRKGTLMHQSEMSDGTTRLVFEITTRGMLGLRNQLLTLSRGTAVSNSMFLDFRPMGAVIPRLRNGVLIASETGKAVIFGLNNAQGRGITFIEPQTEIYRGMIVGLNSREGDLDINVAKEKQLTNIRSAHADEALVLTPATVLSLEQCIDFLEDDELLEVTPKNLRLRKKILDPTQRNRARKPNSQPIK
jgi:GTP-binding protein